MGDDKVSNDLLIFCHGNGDAQDQAPKDSSSSSEFFNDINVNSSISDLLNLEDVDSANPFLVDVPVSNEPRDRDSEQPDSPFFDQLDTPKIYIAPRVAVSHQDSFSEDSHVDDHVEEMGISSGSPRKEARQELAPLPRLRVPGSPRTLVYPRAAVSPRFGSPRGGVESPMSSSGTPKVGVIDTTRSIIISVEEYYELSKRAHEAEEAANARLAEIVAQIEVAKEDESRILEKLEEVNREMAVELEKSPRSSTEQTHKDHSFSPSTDTAPRSPDKPGPDASGGQGTSNNEAHTNVIPETKKKKKKFSLFPKVFMFLSRKKSHK